MDSNYIVENIDSLEMKNFCVLGLVKVLHRISELLCEIDCRFQKIKNILNQEMSYFFTDIIQSHIIILC